MRQIINKVYIGRCFKIPSLKQITEGFYKSRHLYLIFFPIVAYYIIFKYIPIYGLLMAFENYTPFKGVFGSEWVGFKHIINFFNSVFFWNLIRNTIVINIYSLSVGFPAPIILALLINEVRRNKIKTTVQTIVYLPYFVSTVVVCGIIVAFLSPSTGIINILLKEIGIQPIHFLAESGWFSTIYVFSDMWQTAGWYSIIYLAALTAIDPLLYEAGTVDGASAWQKLCYITIPGIIPTIIIMFILRIGSIFTVGYEKIILLYNPLTYATGDVISSYVYRRGILKADFSYATAMDLFNNTINFIAIITFNRLSRKISETSLW